MRFINPRQLTPQLARKRSERPRHAARSQQPKHCQNQHPAAPWLLPAALFASCFFRSKAPDVENFAWLPVGVNSNKPARGSVSLI